MVVAITDPVKDNLRLSLNFSGRLIDHLGLQMYQSPVAAIAELVANAWDADAENVTITLPDDLTDGAEIIVADDGHGMTSEECQQRFLNVGFARRGTDKTEKSRGKKRRILGRKGIGKFAGFGVARVIRIETTSRENGERTVFEMDIEKLRSAEYVNVEGSPVDVIEHEEADPERQKNHGTVVRLKTLGISRRITPNAFATSMARRFLLHQTTVDFGLTVNGQELPEADDILAPQFSFPDEFRNKERPEGLKTSNGWGAETAGDNEVRWKVRFYEEPIGEEELRGISVFAGGKMVQAPFFFNLSGSLPGQHGQQYISGQIQADFLDEQEQDLIAPERQRVNWDHDAANELQTWGRDRLRQLLRIWRDRRGEERHRQLEERLGAFGERLGRLSAHERETVSRAIRRVAQIETLSDSQFQDLGTAMVTAWEHGRLHDLIDAIAKSDNLTAEQLVDILAEAQVLTALNTAEAVTTKILTVNGLKERVDRRELENAVRNYISNHPWLISPKWETFAVERSVNRLIEDAQDESGIANDMDFRGRVDLALASGEHLLVLEFMRPGLTLDFDHVNRFQRYVRIIEEKLTTNTGGRFHRVSGYVVADGIHTRTGLPAQIRSMERDDMFALDWPTLFSNATAQWKEFLDILSERDPTDPRLQALLAEWTGVEPPDDPPSTEPVVEQPK